MFRFYIYILGGNMEKLLYEGCNRLGKNYNLENREVKEMTNLEKFIYSLMYESEKDNDTNSEE